MDFVIPYINNQDTVWQEQYLETCKKMNLQSKLNSQRFRNWDNFIYIFRGIEKFMPWIDKVHLIVSNKEQVPDWINTDEVNIVLHEEIIPKEFLPTFNSCTIEMFIHNIPGLSKNFIYSNDDIFILNHLKEEDFFEYNYPKLKFNTISCYNSLNTMYKTVMLNEYKDIAKLFGKLTGTTWAKPEHGMNPISLKNAKETYLKLERKILNSCTKFRNEKNMNQNIYTYYNYFDGSFKESKRTHKYFDFSNGIIKTLNEIKDSIKNQKYQTICINDNIDFSELDETFNICKNSINSALNSLFPNKSKYEKKDNDFDFEIKENHIQVDDGIDFVFPYVTSDDVEWQKIYKKYVGNKGGWSAGIERFRDSGTLKYLFRSIEKNMPWINKVHMVVCSETQVPYWINRDNVNIITHDKFIPKEYLPTFNSTAIEMFLPNLPNVSEKFIYSNDDLFAFRPLKETYFYKKNIPSYQITLRNFVDTAPGDVIRRNCYNLITGEVSNNNRVVTTQHGTISYRMSWIKECQDMYKEKILKSCTKFREDKNFNQYIYAFYQMFEKTVNNSDKKIACYITNKKQMPKILDAKFETCDFVCINDDNSTTKEDWEKIIKKLDNYFPTKSKYEL